MLRRFLTSLEGKMYYHYTLQFSNDFVASVTKPYLPKKCCTVLQMSVVTFLFFATVIMAALTQVYTEEVSYMFINFVSLSNKLVQDYSCKSLYSNII